MINDTHTAEEIFELFEKSDLDSEFKSIIMIRFNAMCQGMYNAVIDPKGKMMISNTHGDMWVEEYNRLVTEYQRVCN